MYWKHIKSYLDFWVWHLLIFHVVSCFFNLDKVIQIEVACCSQTMRNHKIVGCCKLLIDRKKICWFRELDVTGIFTLTPSWINQVYTGPHSFAVIFAMLKNSKKGPTIIHHLSLCCCSPVWLLQFPEKRGCLWRKQPVPCDVDKPQLEYAIQKVVWISKLDYTLCLLLCSV